jgi:lysophospholipase L1-like esterase
MAPTIIRGAEPTVGSPLRPGQRRAAPRGRTGRSARRRSWRSLAAPLALGVALIVSVLAGTAGTASSSEGGGTSSGSASVVTGGSGSAAGGGAPRWVPAFTSAMAWTPGAADDTTVRQVVPLGIGGTLVRVQLSNLFGTGPLSVGAASVGVRASGPDAVPGSIEMLSFDNSSSSTTIPAGGSTWSDPVEMSTHAGEDLLVSVWVSGPAEVTSHYDAGPLSYATYNGAGDLVAAASSTAIGLPSTWDRWVAAVDVAGTAGPASATVAFGDSISDGFNIACGKSDICQATTPWPDFLQERIDRLPVDRRTSVVDESITANTLTPIDTPLADRYRVGGGGPPGLDRMTADVLDQPGVKRVILLIGTNDLWFGASATQLIDGYKTFLARAEAKGIEVIGSTLLPREGSDGWTAADQAKWAVVNHWILTSRAFPVVLDLAPVVADVYNGACQPYRLFPPYNSGDSLHPDSAGQLAMADAIPTGLIDSAGAPTLPHLVAATPTAGCPHPEVVRVYRSVASTSTTSTPPTTATGSTGTTPSTTTRAPVSTASGRRKTPPANRSGGKSATGKLAASTRGLGTGSIVGILIAAVAVLIGARALSVRRQRRARRRRRELAAELRRQHTASGSGYPQRGWDQ